ncbi:MAG: hypothetical protein H2042_01790 [Rhizobiales bacterium]|nr:hypothetical protein [Hyphomicrobiales bacterium]
MEKSASSRLRWRIDSGATGDKVAFPDLAAAPLGTDDEAAGTHPQGIQQAAHPGVDLTRPEGKEDPRSPTNQLPTGGTWMLVFGGLLTGLLVLATLSWVLDA